jgi:hypothetical protein
MSAQQGPTKLYNMAELAELLEVSTSLVHRLHREDKLGVPPAYEAGGKNYPLWTADQVALMREARGLDD